MPSPYLVFTTYCLLSLRTLLLLYKSLTGFTDSLKKKRSSWAIPAGEKHILRHVWLARLLQAKQKLSAASALLCTSRVG